jgi:hypothetical protein
MDDGEARALRGALRRIERGRGKRVPAALRARATAWIQRQRSSGASVREIADALPLSYETVRRWAELTEPRPTALVPVTVEPEPVSGDGLELVSPSGYRVERLSAQQVVAILRELG